MRCIKKETLWVLENQVPKIPQKTLRKEASADLCKIWETLRDTIIIKLERLQKLIYSFGMKGFEEVERKKTEPMIQVSTGCKNNKKEKMVLLKKKKVTAEKKAEPDVSRHLEQA